jgi:hypothetical protein
LIPGNPLPLSGVQALDILHNRSNMGITLGTHYHLQAFRPWESIILRRYYYYKPRNPLPLSGIQALGIYYTNSSNIDYYKFITHNAGSPLPFSGVQTLGASLDQFTIQNIQSKWVVYGVLQYFVKHGL